MSPQSTNIKKRHSFYTTEAPHTSLLQNIWKSDINIVNSNGDQPQKSYEDYYKKYEHDEIPVKDDCSFNDHSFSEGHDSGNGDNNSGIGDNKDSITNSYLDKLELKILNKMSQELQSDASTVSSLDSNIKLFKITVQQIFDNFYSNLEDFELYKKRFNEILEQNKGDYVTEIEEFVSNIIQHIGSSDSSLSHNNKEFNKSPKESKNDDTRELFTSAVNYEMTKSLYKTNQSFVESCKQGGCVTNSTFDGLLNLNSPVKKDDTSNINLDNRPPCLEVIMNDRNLVSEINLRDQSVPEMKNFASADNIKKLEAKKLELEKYLNHKERCILERNIPVKNSNAKKNIYLNEDFEHNQQKDENKFFLFKICSYICKKLRRS